MVAMVGCLKVVNDPRVRVRTRARVFKYPSDHVDHVRPFISYYYNTFYASTWSGTWSAHGIYCLRNLFEFGQPSGLERLSL